MPQLPTGTVTFLLTDIEGSSALWEARSAEMQAAVAAHEEIVASRVSAHGGALLKQRGEGDSTFSVFANAVDAVLAAADVLQGLNAVRTSELPLFVRIAVHTGDAAPRDGDYFSPVVNTCARLRGAAHGGQALVSGATAALCRHRLPAGTELRSLGTYRLRGLACTEAVFQVVRSDLPDAFPPLCARLVADDRLPLELTSFVGREAEVEHLLRVVAASRLLTLTGLGGVGKTRLARRVAALVGDEHRDGARWIDLAPIDDPGLVPQAIGTALGLRSDSAREPTEAVLDCLRDRDCLVVLDSCEHLADACAAVVQRILAGCPTVQVLATSRQPLGLYGEQVWPVPPLALPPAPAIDRAVDPETALCSDAVRLFVERARLRQPHFAATADNVGQIGEICRQLEGIPLSIELVAAKVGVQSLRDLAAGTRECFGALTASGLRLVPDRQKSLHAAVAWCHASLDGSEALLFRRLAVFRGWFRLADAAALEQPDTADTDLLDLLARLHAKSMLVADTGGDSARFRLLEPLRQFGLEKLDEAGETTPARDAHLERLVALAEAAEPGLRSRDLQRWLDLLDDAADDVRMAVHHALETERPNTGLRLASAAWRYWYTRGRPREGRDLLERLLDRATTETPDEVRAKALHAFGTLAAYVGDYRQARSALESCLAIRRRLGDPTEVAATLNNLGIVDSEVGDLESTRDLYLESIALKVAAGDRRGEAGSLANLASVRVELGEYLEAEEAAQASLALSRELDDPADSVVALQVQAHIAEDRGDLALAEQLSRQSLALAEQLGLNLLVANRSVAIGNVRLLQGDTESAEVWLAEGLRLARRSGSRRAAASALVAMGELALARKDPAAALDHFGQARALQRGDPRRLEMALAELGLACAQLLAGDLLAAWLELAAGLALIHDRGYRMRLFRFIETAARLALADGDPHGALRLAEASSAARTKLRTPLPPAQRAEMEAAVAAATNALGDAVAEAHKNGPGPLTIEQACALILEREPPRSRATPREGGS